MTAIVAFAAEALNLSCVASLEVPVIMAKQMEQKTIEHSNNGRRPILSVSRAPRRAPKKQMTGYIPLSIS